MLLNIKEKKENENNENREIALDENKENMMMPGDTIPGDSEEINTDNNINITKINLPNNVKKIKHQIKPSITENNINEEIIPIKNKKKVIQIPKSNSKYSSKSPDTSKAHKKKEIEKDLNQSPDYKIKHKRSNSNNEIKNISKDEL